MKPVVSHPLYPMLKSRLSMLDDSRSRFHRALINGDSYAMSRADFEITGHQKAIEGFYNVIRRECGVKTPLRGRA